ncbi:hypothetical protein ACVWXQ_001839 [Bradyrhizobium sp. S3.14.4]
MSETRSITGPGPELDDIVRQLQACAPLHPLSSMEARTVCELLLQRGWRIVRVKPIDGAGGANARAS